MRIEIYDVAHGACASILKDDGRLLMVDCGHNDETDFHPSSYLLREGHHTVQALFISNYDRDHFSDLPNLRSGLHIESLYRNRSINSAQLRALKLQSGPIGVAMESLLQMIDEYSGDIGVDSPIFDTGITTFSNPYPSFDDTNNLSLVTFLNYRNINIVFPGDLECAGWTQLLLNSAFREALSKVQIFVASHHGRESGYCPEVFDYCNPQIVIISDDVIQYDTQEAVDYAVHARGVSWPDGTVRRVLTTRNDGMISIWQGPQDASWFISHSR